MEKRMKRLMKVWLIGTAVVLFSACDAHEDFPDTSMKVCHVLCTDGEVVPYDSCVTRGMTAIGVVFYVNQVGLTEGDGYAVYLWDTEPVAFADSLASQGTSADLSAYDGNTNTYAIFASGVASPMANTVFDMWWYGQSAYVPSVMEMRLLYAAKETINPLIEQLGGDVLPDDADECWYWTSTEVSGQEDAKAWLYSMGSGAIQETPKTQPHKVRPVITLNE